MKRNLIFLILLISIIRLSAEWVEIPENHGNEIFEHTSYNNELTDIHFSLPGYEVETVTENGVDYQKISYLNEGEILETGKPYLPQFSRLIAIPDAGNVEYEIVYSEEEIIRNINVFPSQDLQFENQPTNNEFVIDEAYYQSGDVFPGRLVEIGEPAILRDFRVVDVTINPFQYDPQTKTLKIIKNIDIVVNASGRGGINTKTLDRKKSRFFEPLYRSVILNYDDITERDVIYQDPSYLFIYPNNAGLLDVLEFLSDWKHQKGFTVTLASTVDTGTSNTSIKNYIQNAYDTWENPPEFVCLVGDANGTFTIPTFYETYSYFNGEGDHPYAQLEGDDVLEDVFIGRISISTLTHMQTYVSKVLNYEKEPYMGETDWYDSSVMVGDPTHSGPSTVFINQYIVELMQYYAPNITATQVYSGDYSGAMVSNLNSGVSFLNYRGYIGMSNFGISQIFGLTNGLKLPFAVFPTCSTGSFASEESRSEAFIRAGSPTNQKGAIAAIGTATSGTHTQFNNCISAGIYYGIFADGLYNPGGGVNRGKLSLFINYPLNPGNAVNIFSHWNTLIGDPGVELWTGVPQEMIVDYDSEISPGTDYLEVTVTNDVGEPLENAWVTALMGDDDIFATGYTDAEGYIALPVYADLEGTASLTVTKHNYIPHLGEVDVAETNRFVNVLNVIVDDDNSGTSSGNGDGLINPGESIELQVELKNFGTQTANSVTAVISSDDDFVTITDNSETYGNIASGASVFSSDDFDFSVDESTLGGTELRIDISIEDNAGNQWTDIIFLVVEGANLDEMDYTVVDGGNGILDPGELAQMNVTLLNLGSAAANAVYGELSSTNSRIIISDSIGYFGNIQANGQVSNTTDSFELMANTQVVVGTQVVMELHLYNAEGYDDTTQFILNVGEVTINDPLGPDTYSYFCYDDGDVGYFNVPTYEWIEINNIGTNLNLNDSGDTGDVENIDLPISFSMYGVNYSMATVCSNGWIAPGGCTQASFMNTRIPGPQGPSPMIAPFWDDLRTGYNGHVYWYYDSDQHFVVIEWDHMQNDFNSSEETFQAILYDVNYFPTFTGDSEIKFQYKVIHNDDAGGGLSEHGQYSTVGIEDHTETVGIEYTFNNTYPVAAKTLQNEMALLFTTSSQYWGFVAGLVTLDGGTANVDEVIIGNGLTYTHPDQTGNYVYPLLPGSYDLTAELAGYAPDTATDVNVVENETTIVNFTLVAFPIPTEFVCNVVDYNDVELSWDTPESSDTGRKTNLKRIENSTTVISRDLLGYRVYRDSVMIAEINDPAIMIYSDPALAAGTYEYWITAIHDFGESRPCVPETAIIIFPAPQNPQAVTQGTGVLISWDIPAARELVSYKVYRNLVLIAADIVDTYYLDPDLPNGVYSYNVRAVYSGGYQSVLSADAVINHVQTNVGENLIPQVTCLLGNYPNPFNPTTEISFALKAAGRVDMEIFNLRGQKVRTLVSSELEAGYHKAIWDGKDDADKAVTSGIYFYKMHSENYSSTMKMILMK
ncbi:MAG: C25 family cysteine peptidase [Candidatus Cloacimonadales bacterium]|nr:C25 family cysteine peptidase [Candidatus Cloacimonadales bacterium]